jgi:short-subunit dehydrogenase
MKNYALVTGASKGIGREIALRLAEMGYPLLLVARDETALSELAGLIKNTCNVEASFLSADLAEAGATEKVFSWATTGGYHLQILVNNAGYGLWGNFERLNLAHQMNMISLNINALVELTYLFLPALKQEQQAYILNVSSTAAYQAVPTLSVYAATKAFVLQFSRGIAVELKNSPVSVSCLCPGATDTHFMDRAGMDAIKHVAEKFNMPPAEVAKTAVEGMFRKEAEIIPGLTNKITSKLVAFIPKALTERIAANLYKVPERKK